MKMYLLDNGIDSLKMGMDFFDKYLENDHNADIQPESYLKLSLICVQNSIEIFGKETLSRINELIIYKDLPNSLLETLKQKYQYSVKKPLYNLLINQDSSIKTITYTDCISKLKALFGLTDETQKYLLELGEIRNKVTHFGINREIDFYEVIVYINFSLDFIIEFFYPIYKSVTPHPFDILYDELVSVLEEGQIAEEDQWGAIHQMNFIELNSFFQQACSDMNEKNHKNFCLEFENEGYTDSRNFYVNVVNRDGYLSTISTLNIMNFNSTVLYNSDQDNGSIYAFYDHNKQELFTPKSNLKIKEILEEGAKGKITWQRKFGNQFRKKALDLATAKEIMTTFLGDLES